VLARDKKTGPWWPVFFGLVFVEVAPLTLTPRIYEREQGCIDADNLFAISQGDQESNMLCDKSDNGKQGQGERSTDAERQQRNPDCGRSRAPHLFS
jgi:hypothetical protein